MKVYINCTEDGVKKYPRHSHKNWEIMFYLWGTGYLYTPEADYPFKEGMAIIVPPGVEHCSVSENGFKNISIGGDFKHLLFFDKPRVVFDNDDREGKLLAELIFKNRYSNKEYVSYLCHSYIFFLLQNLEFENRVNLSINKIVSKIIDKACDTEINLVKILESTGYAEDYIRFKFKEVMGQTPVEFLTKIRIEQAIRLLDIYQNEISINELSEKCGYYDAAYFSKRFKALTGVSPRKYICCSKNND